MACVSSAQFAVLIDGSPTRFFGSFRGLGKGCLLSPLIYLLVIEALSRMIHRACQEENFTVIKFALALKITHLLFNDDVICDFLQPCKVKWVEESLWYNIYFFLCFCNGNQFGKILYLSVQGIWRGFEGDKSFVSV